MEQLFHIPESDEDLHQLFEDILARNSGNIDIQYMFVVGKEVMRRHLEREHGNKEEAL